MVLAVNRKTLVKIQNVSKSFLTQSLADKLRGRAKRYIKRSARCPLI